MEKHLYYLCYVRYNVIKVSYNKKMQKQKNIYDLMIMIRYYMSIFIGLFKFIKWYKSFLRLTANTDRRVFAEIKYFMKNIREIKNKRGIYVMGFKEANENEIEVFKKKYCYSEKDRLSLIENFKINVLSYEELLPSQQIYSYATWNKRITGKFIIFEVIDEKNEVIYYPVFSYSVAHILIKRWNLKLPKLISILSEPNNVDNGHFDTGNEKKFINKEAKQIIILIQYARAMMTLNIDHPKPVNGVFKSIYDKYITLINIDKEVEASDIKSINTAIKNFISKNHKKISYASIPDFIEYLENEYPDKIFKSHEFDDIRKIMASKYPNEIIAF